MLVRALQQRAIVVAVRRIQERGQEYADVHTSIIECSQNIAVIFATGTMEMGVNDHGIESPFQQVLNVPGGFQRQGVSSCGQRDLRSTPCTEPTKTQARASASSGYS